MKYVSIGTIIAMVSVLSVNAAEEGKHLFILAGQSNMAGLDQQLSFQPMVEEAFGKENVIIVKEVESGQSILRWYKEWDVKKGGEIPVDKKTGKPGKLGDVYDRLLDKARKTIEGKNIQTVTFCWMQGESDAYALRCDIYKESFLGLMARLSKDLQRDDITVVIGRINDARMHVPEWRKIRQVQEELANMHKGWAWINTDDCNEGKNKEGKQVKDDLHCSVDGYKTMGNRFAEAAITLIKRSHEQSEPFDLVTPVMTKDEPGPGKRVRQVAPEYKGTQVYHALYLPVDWELGKTYPVIVEYTGNKFPACGSTGEVKDANLGYGLSGGRGFIWVSMPYVAEGRKDNAVTWWGDKQATVDYCKVNLPRICKQFGGDPDNVFICGFSRGAIAVSYIGLADDEIAKLWKGFIAHDHFDGQKKWNYPEDDRASALKRLARLKGRPVLVCGGANDFLKEHLNLAKFTFLPVPTKEIFKIPEGKVIHPHTDLWLHKKNECREKARAWLGEAVRKGAQLPLYTDGGMDSHAEKREGQSQ